jgi:Rod binding domain-containing protein
MLVTEVRKTMPESFLGDGPAEMFADLFDQALADSLAEGGSLGIAAHFEAQSGNEK